MAIKQKTFFVGECDVCGEKLDSAGVGSFTVYETYNEAHQAMKGCEWTWKNGKARCCSCYEQ